MSHKRLFADLALPEPLSPAAEGRFNAACQVLRLLKADAVKINEGLDNEEDTARVVTQICRHNEGKPCDPWEDI